MTFQFDWFFCCDSQGKGYDDGKASPSIPCSSPLFPSFSLFSFLSSFPPSFSHIFIFEFHQHFCPCPSVGVTKEASRWPCSLPRCLGTFLPDSSKLAATSWPYTHMCSVLTSATCTHVLATFVQKRPRHFPHSLLPALGLETWGHPQHLPIHPTQVGPGPLCL